MPTAHQLDREKLKEAVLLIASHCPPDELGNVKLHKALYFSDMMYFLQEGRPLTGVEYLKQQFGPTARHLSSAVSELERERRLTVSVDEYFGVYKKTYRPTSPFQPQRLNENEIALIREMADFVRGRSAKEISALSHDAAWASVEMGEVIPYFTALRLVPAEINDDDRQRALDSTLEYATQPLPL